MQWIGLYLSFHLNRLMGSFVHGRLQNLQTSEVTFAYVVTLLSVSNGPNWLFHCFTGLPHMPKKPSHLASSELSLHTRAIGRTWHKYPFKVDSTTNYPPSSVLQRVR